MKNGDKSIHPIQDQIHRDDGTIEYVSGGLTKREYFAVMAMQGFIASYTGQNDSPDCVMAAQYSVKYADALLAELEKPNE